MNQLYSYDVNIEREFGKGVKPRGLQTAEKSVAEKKEKLNKWHERLQRDYARSEADPSNVNLKAEVNEALDGFEKAKEDYERAKEALFTGDVFGTHTPEKTIGLIETNGPLSLADLYDIKVETNGKVSRLVVENYEDNGVHSVVSEGGVIPSANIGDFINVIKTDRESVLKIGGIIDVPEAMLSDEKDLLNGAIDSVQDKHSANTETMLLCNAIMSSKEAIPVTAETLSSVVNSSLCANARLGAEIITNENGFSKLDVTDANGNYLVKKNFSINQFVFADRYILRVLPNELLNDNENGSPVLVGDWKNALRLAVVKTYPPLEKHDLYNCVIENRAIEKIIPVLTTNSDKAYIVGSI